MLEAVVTNMFGQDILVQFSHDATCRLDERGHLVIKDGAFERSYPFWRSVTGAGFNAPQNQQEGHGT